VNDTDGGAGALVPSEGTSKAVGVLLDGLNWIYDRALEGGGGLASAEDTARTYSASAANVEEAIGSLIRWQVGKASATGFVANLGGLITLPVAIPVNLGAVAYIQLNMVASIAKLRGYDVRDDRVRTIAMACLAGGGAIDLLKDAGVQFGTKVAARAINSISGALLRKINQFVGFRLVTKAGTTGVVNLTKLVPFFGGVVGGAIDGATTRGIGGAAKVLFPAITADDVEVETPMGVSISKILDRR
jgi:uncharacterized protein (DUF697 family)